MARKSRLPKLFAVTILTGGLALGTTQAQAQYQPGEPPNINPGTPTFAGSATPVPTPPAATDPSRGVLQAIFDADVANGGTSYWFDRILARPFLNNADNALMTRGRGLYMYTHAPGTLGFAGSGTGPNGGGGYAYRQPPTTSVVNLYTVAVSGGALSEDTARRIQFPSYYSAAFTRAGLTVAEKKFITQNNVAITDLTLTNTGSAAATTTLTATSPIATTPTADGTELTGTVTARYGLTTLFPRFSGGGFAVSGTSLVRTLTLAAGESATVKLQEGVTTRELPGSSAEYGRYRDLDPDTAWRTQLREYNQFWVDNVPYLDIPDKNVEKISYYRTWENRFNSFDGDIPGNDYQFPVDLEGALGYNNQISLTVPMRMQDLQFWRDPLFSYGPWLSQGEESGCQAFHDNPGNTGNWNNTYEQWTAAQAWQSYLVHGGPPSVLANLARYSECDVKGTLAKFDTNHDNLIEYSSGTLPGNDADSVAFKYYGTRPQDRTESSYWYSAALAAAAEYTALGQTAKAADMTGIANNIRTAILDNLWAAGPIDVGGGGGAALGPRATGRIGNAIRLNGSGEYVNLPTGIVSGLDDVTIAAWVNPSANTAWSRVFDFGTGTTANMFMTVSAGGGPLRFAITTAGGGAEQRLDAPGTLPLNTWSHVAVTLSGDTGTLYVNGTAVATNTNMTIHPAALGNTNQNWLGRSQYGDPFLNGAVDDFQIYGRALSGAQVQALAGGQAGAGDVASYKFDEASGATAVDSSGAGRAGTVLSPQMPANACPGQVFLQKDLTTGNLVCWKDQQNFAPFIDGIPPNTDQFKQALRYYADRTEFPIMPVYTADQADQAANLACEACPHGTNNFSNINATLQARLYSKALRDYPSPFITPDMYRQLIEWLSWNEFINGDNRFPDNNEFFFNWNPANQTLGRSGIHHDVLGSYNWMFFQDLGGLQPRIDDTLELSPIDVGYDHFMMNNLSYHGSNLSVVWQKPGGTVFYPSAPAGYSVYVDGRRAFTVDDLAHVTWSATTGAVSVLDSTGAHVSFHAALPLRKATDVSLSGNARVTGAFQKAGLDLTGAPGSANDLARGRTASASFTTTSPAAQATSPANAVDGFTTSGLPVTSGAYVGTNPIWGDAGSPNAQDWLQVDLGAPTRLNDVKLYFYSNKAFGAGGGTYREPASYTVQVLNGSTWVDVAVQVKAPATAAPNLNEVTFAPLVTRQLRVLMTRQSGFGVGVKEVQAFDLESMAVQVTSTQAFIGGIEVSAAVRNALTVQLTQAMAQDRAGQQARAVATLDAFAEQVDTYAASATLPPDAATFLTASATAMQVAINS
jgi:Concanavalin A-like lectin/glucanases superfamily/NedA-like, galactose-binding domain